MSQKKKTFLGLALKKRMPWEPDWLISGLSDKFAGKQYTICSTPLVMGLEEYFTVGDCDCDYAFDGLEGVWGAIRFSEETDGLVCEKWTEQVTDTDRAERYTCVEVESGVKIPAGHITLSFEAFDGEKYQIENEEAES